MLLLHCNLLIYSTNNVVGDEDSELIAIAKSNYFFDEERDRIIKIDCEQKLRRSIPTMLYDH